MQSKLLFFILTFLIVVLPPLGASLAAPLSLNAQLRSVPSVSISSNGKASFSRFASIYPPAEMSVQTSAPSLQASSSNSWAIGAELIPGSMPSSIQGVMTIAYLPLIPSGLTGNPYYYAEVLSVIFPNGLLFQISVGAYPASDSNCASMATPCYVVKYDYSSTGATCTIDSVAVMNSTSLPRGEHWVLAVWWTGQHWMYLAGYGSATDYGGGVFDWSLNASLVGQLNSLQTILSSVDLNDHINAFDSRCSGGSNSQEFAALESYDYSLADWQKIGTIHFAPAVEYVTSPSSSFPSYWSAAPAAVAVGASQSAVDLNGNHYWGSIGCCSGMSNLPFTPYVGGNFQGYVAADYWNEMSIGYNESTAGARYGSSGTTDIIWASAPTIASARLSPPSISAGQSFQFYYQINNPNSFNLTIGLGASIRGAGCRSSACEINDSSNEITVILPARSAVNVTRSFASSSILAPGWYDALWSLWSGSPNISPSARIASTGWQMKQLYMSTPTSGGFLSPVIILLTAIDACLLLVVGYRARRRSVPNSPMP